MCFFPPRCYCTVLHRSKNNTRGEECKNGYRQASLPRNGSRRSPFKGIWVFSVICNLSPLFGHLHVFLYLWALRFEILNQGPPLLSLACHVSEVCLLHCFYSKYPWLSHGNSHRFILCSVCMHVTCRVKLQAIADLGWAQPTLIQEKAIPLALDGKDLLARARTGSGKTAAYAIPVIQRILTSKQVCVSPQHSTTCLRQWQLSLVLDRLDSGCVTCLFWHVLNLHNHWHCHLHH